ncbi:hypothetical protein HRI_001946500 [Hibiscus trionum]|uniref:Uncharacterized protein n=1 Tax=Hibiscus trionum TaxID=183268 RepID=A0A9W7LYM5_HIBTR|nr:hypothetical protein HRI_001946500 [Hibiscus trionum]
MGFTPLLHSIAAYSSSFSAARQLHFFLLGTNQGLPISKLSTICINLTLLLLFLLLISARQILICVGRTRFIKDDSVGNPSQIRRSISVDGEFQDATVSTGFKSSVFCCFYVLLVQVVVLGFDGFGLIRKTVDGKVVDWFVIALPAAQGLAWSVLSFSALHCKFKGLVKFPLLLRVWWVISANDDDIVFQFLMFI